MDIEISEMQAGDYDQVVTLWKLTEGIGLDAVSDSAQGIRKYLERNPQMSFVARVKDDPHNIIVGAVLCGHDGRRGYLHHLAVDPSCRGRGIGARLVEKCLAALRSQGIAKCNIFVFADNEGGLGFWRKTGWKGPRNDLKVMQRPLGEIDD